MGSNHAHNVQRNERMSIADKLCRADSITLGGDGLREKLGRAPCVESLPVESEGEREAFVNSLELWVRDEVVRDTANECEKEWEIELAILRQQNESLQERISRLLAESETKIEAMERKRDREVSKLVTMFEKRKENNEKVTAINVKRREEEGKVFQIVDGKFTYQSENTKAREELTAMHEIEMEIRQWDKRAVRDFCCDVIGVQREFPLEELEAVPFPVDMLSMSVESFQSWFKRYVRGNIEKCYVGYVYWKMVVMCYDPDEGCHLRPIDEEAIPEKILETYKRQSDMLLLTFKAKLGDLTMSIINTQCYYGYNNRCASPLRFQNNMTHILHSILTKLTNVNENVNEIEKDIFDLPERLKRGIPFEALHNVNALVGKAEKYNVQITHTLINKCYNVLNQRHIYFSLMMPQNIQFPSGCNSRNKCGRQLQILKLEVETKSKTIERIWMGNEESKESFWEKNRYSYQEKEEKEKIEKEVAEVKTKIPTCEAKDCKSEVSRYKRGKTKPYPAHPSNLCKIHLQKLIDDKYVPKERGGYIMNKKEEGKWKYITVWDHPCKKKRVGE